MTYKKVKRMTDKLYVISMGLGKTKWWVTII